MATTTPKKKETVSVAKPEQKQVTARLPYQEWEDLRIFCVRRADTTEKVVRRAVKELLERESA